MCAVTVGGQGTQAERDRTSITARDSDERNLKAVLSAVVGRHGGLEFFFQPIVPAGCRGNDGKGLVVTEKLSKTYGQERPPVARPSFCERLLAVQSCAYSTHRDPDSAAS